MRTISAHIVYYTQGNYGPVQHDGGKQYFFTKEELTAAVRNADSVLRRSGANHIALDRDSRIAFQVSGYNGVRGAFVDVLPAEELIPFVVPVPGSVSPFCAVPENV